MPLWERDSSAQIRRLASTDRATGQNDRALGAIIGCQALNRVSLLRDGVRTDLVSSSISVSHCQNDFPNAVRFGKAFVCLGSLVELKSLGNQRVNRSVDKVRPNMLRQSTENLAFFFSGPRAQEITGHHSLFGHHAQKVNRPLYATLSANNHPTPALG